MGKVSLPSSSPKTASLVGSIDHGRSIESCRARMASQDDPLAVKMAEGMRSTSARDAFSFGYFSLGMQRKVTRHQGEITCLITSDNKLEVRRCRSPCIMSYPADCPSAKTIFPWALPGQGPSCNMRDCCNSCLSQTFKRQRSICVLLRNPA